MTTSNSTSISRKIVLGLGAIVVSTMTLAGANQAQAGVKIYLGFGGVPHYGGHYGYWDGPSCYYFKKKWKHTGSWYWKKKYFKCMGWW
jgi:hypothetical protein